MADFIAHFSIIEDPRQERCKKYPLIEILFLCMVAVIADAGGWEEIEDFGVDRQDWLRRFLPYDNGIPGHDAIARVMSRLEPKALQSSFMNWMKDVVDLTEGQVIAIDGKTVRRSFKNGDRRSAIHMVSAFATANLVTLGQVKVDEKSNEITAIPELLDLLTVKGCIITIDAMGCQTAIAEKIIEGGGDYVLSVKDNQPTLNEEVQLLFKEHPVELNSDFHEEITKDHGRIETRRCRQIEVNLEWLPDGERWRGIRSVVEILSRREMNNGTVTEETRYFISSLKVGAKKAFDAIRSHWLIENSLHWSLDMSYREDECRIRRQNGAEFFTVLRRLSLNIIKKDQSKKAGISRKRKMAARNTDYLMQLMCHFQTV